MHIGIVGHEASKFTADGKQQALAVIRKLLSPEGSVLVSGGCHLGGIDIWAEEVADELQRDKIICLPNKRQWSGGYKERNIEIATLSNVLHCIAVDQYAPAYSGMKFTECYHCNKTDHAKGGGCWTMKRAALLGKPIELHIINNVRDSQ